MFVNDEVDQFGNNASIILSQTRREEAKQSRVYLGNGRTAALNNQLNKKRLLITTYHF